jgi:hypothetical protein
VADGSVRVAQASTGDRLIDNVTAVTDEGTVYRQRVDVAPAVTRKILDYSGRTDGNPVYVGFAFQGDTIAEAVWTVYKLFYDGSNRLVDQQVAERLAWSSRTGYSWRSSAGD